MPRTTRTRRPRPAAKPTARRRVGASVLGVVLAVLRHGLAIGMSMIWIVIGILFVLYVTTKATGIGLVELFREEWALLRRARR